MRYGDRGLSAQRMSELNMDENDATSRSGPEWIGRRLLAPMYITEGEPYRPEVILWMESPKARLSARIR